MGKAHATIREFVAKLVESARWHQSGLLIFGCR